MTDLYRQIFSAQGEALLWEDASGVIAEANGAALRLLNRRREDVIGQHVSGLFSPATLERIKAHRISERSKELLSQDAQLKGGGAPVNVLLETQHIETPDGWLHAARAVTAREELDRELRLQRQAAGLGYGGVRPATFYYSSRDEIFRYPPLKPGDPPRALDGVATLLRTDRLRPAIEQGWAGEEVRVPPAWYEIASPDGKLLKLRLRIAIIPLRLKGAEVTDLCIRVLDETQAYLEEEERRWREQQQHAELILSGVEQDLNSLLGVVLAQASALRLATPMSQMPPPQLQAIIDAAHKMAALTRVPDAEGLAPTTPVNLNKLLDDCGVDLSFAGGERGTGLRLMKEAETCLVPGDAGLLREMILSYARYLQRHLAKGAVLALKTYFLPSATPGLPPPVGLSMGDDGTSGAGGGTRPPEDPSKSRELALARAILRMHRGQCEAIESSAQGLLLEITLPGADTRPTLSSPDLIHSGTFDDGIRAPKVLDGAQSVPAAARTRILLADDEENFRLFTAWALRERGYDVVVAKDGLEALDRFQEAPDSFGLVVLDSYMPRMGGLEAYLRMQSQRSDLPVLFASGYVKGPSGDILISGCPGPASVLQKPFNVDDLAAAVKKALAGKLQAGVA